MQVPKASGTYLLVLHMPEQRQVRVGALGACLLDAGWYLYVGSAMGGLRQRLARHARTHKRLHWHIDYLLAQTTLCGIWYHVGPERLECLWAQALGAAPGFTPYARRLGASDCDCHTHLFYAAQRPCSGMLSHLRPNDRLLVASDAEIKDLAQPARQ